MGKLIVSTQMTVDGVIDSTEHWFMQEGEHEEYGFDQLLAADACGVQLQRLGSDQARCRPGRMRSWWYAPWLS
jgi:hypothetical protein